MRFKDAFSMTLVTQGVIFMLSFANGVLLTRAIGADGRGIYSLVIASVSILSLVASGGLNFSNTFLTGKDRGNLAPVLSNSLVFLAVVSILLYLLYEVLPKNITDLVFKGVEEKYIRFAIALTVLTIASSYLNGINLGMQAFKRFNFFPLIQTVVFLILNIILLYVYDFGVTGVIYACLLSLTVSVSCNALYTFRCSEGFRFAPEFTLFFDGIRIGGRALMSNLFGTLLIRSDIFLVNYFLGIKAVGIYSVAVFMAELIIKIPAIAGTVLFARISKGVDQDGIDLTLKVSRLTGFLSITICIFVLISGSFLLRLAFGNEFNDSYVPMAWLMPGIIGLSFNVILDNFYAGRGYPSITVWTPCAALMINVGLNLLLIPHYGISGAAISSSVAYLAMILIKAFYFSRQHLVPIARIFINIKSDFLMLRHAWCTRTVK